MKEFFSIGEISHLLGLSSHTLRYYDKIGLLEPASVNEQTGYRFYAYHQLFTLERIRHLQHLEFSLEEIQAIISDTTMDTFRNLLSGKKEELDREISRLTTLRDTVEQYQRYYQRSDEQMLFNVPFKAHFETRYLFAEAYRPGESLYGTAGYRLMVRKSAPDCSDLNFLRQIGFLLDRDEYKSGRVRPTHYFMMLANAPPESCENVQMVPAGDFLCFRSHILKRDAEISPLLPLLSCDQVPRLVLACELEDSTDDSVQAFTQSCFEIQIQL